MMDRTITCPRCTAPVRTGGFDSGGRTVQCPTCKSAFRIPSARRDASESLRIEEEEPRSGPARGCPPLPPRAATGDSQAPRPGSKDRPARGGLPVEQSRKTIGTILLVGIAGLFVLFVSWYLRTVNTLTVRVDHASADRVAQVESGLQKPPIAKKKQLTAPDAKLAVSPPPEAQIIRPDERAAALAPPRAIAPATVRIGDVVLGVSGVRIGTERIRGRDSSAEYLSLDLRVTNASEKPMHYTGWQRSEMVLVLKGADGSNYNRIKFLPGEFPVGCVEESDIAPGETITDVLVFEAPRPPYVGMQLDLPRADNSVFRFLVPVQMFPNATPTSGGAPAVAQSAPASKSARPQASRPTASPLQDLALRGKIVAEYRERWAKVERRAKGMAYDRGRQYKRTSRTDIVDALSEKYQVSPDDLRQILP